MGGLEGAGGRYRLLGNCKLCCVDGAFNASDIKQAGDESGVLAAVLLVIAVLSLFSALLYGIALPAPL